MFFVELLAGSGRTVGAGICSLDSGVGIRYNILAPKTMIRHMKIFFAALKDRLLMAVPD